MAKDEARKEKKEKKDKKRRASEVDGGLDDATTPVKKEKKSKKERKSTSGGEVETKVVETKVVKDEDGDEEMTEEKTVVKTDGAGALAVVGGGMVVPFANPLCGEKEQKKVLKGVKKAAKSKALKRGVKECVKSIRKSPLANPTTSASTLPPGIVVLAADISPMDVISHIPVLCEDHGIPYLYVPSRAELGAAGSTKRPTSVVMLTPKAGKGAKEEKDGEDDKKDWSEVYADLHKFAVKMGREVKV